MLKNLCFLMMQTNKTIILYEIRVDCILKIHEKGMHSNLKFIDAIFFNLRILLKMNKAFAIYTKIKG